MQTRNIGALSVSAIGLGCNNFGMRIDEAQTKLVVDAALEAGINFFDTADIYGGTKSEEFLGRALGERRKDIVLATKFGMPVDESHKGAAPGYAKQACEDSLRRLGTDFIDLYWLHQPDESVPIADTLGALNELVNAGKVRNIGCSNFSPAQLRQADAEAKRLGGQRFIALQNEMSLLRHEALEPEGGAWNAEDAAGPKRGTVDACAELGLAFVPYFPLASGLFSGKYRLGQPVPEGSRLAVSPRGAALLSEENLQMVERLIAWGEPRGLSILEIAHAWLLAQPTVASVISGATKPEQVAANAKAGGRALTAEELAEVNALLM
jgi:aryl-alcohol dehydrogenase-like predicted oxidoreductase